MNNIQTGLTFYSRPTKIITVLKQFNEQFYRVEDKDVITGNTRSDILLTTEDIQNDLNNQDNIKKGIDKALEFEQHQQELRQQDLQQEAKEQEEYNNVHGYCDNMTPYQKGKVLKTLNKNIRHNNTNITRKEFIKTLLEEGYTLKIIDQMLTNSRKTRELERIETYKYNVPVIEKDSTFYDITKTEYDYGMYLIDNVLQTA